MNRFYLLGIFLLLFLHASSQPYDWWKEKHNWDGHTHWTRYLILSPSHMGPNALPVPEVKKGTLRSKLTLELGGERHSMPGDMTIDLFTELYIPVAKDRAGISAMYVPVEYFKMDSLIRDKRFALDYDGEGISYGDVYVTTWVQIFKDRKYIPDLLFTMNIKTASGTRLDALRNTDTPGYFFDFSAGKKFPLRGAFQYIKPYGQIGFYAYQTYHKDYYQNDAKTYGGGVELAWKNVLINNQIGGFSGYIYEGDQPMVYRFKLETHRENAALDYSIFLQQGLRDFDYTTLRVSVLLNLGTIAQGIFDQKGNLKK